MGNADQSAKDPLVDKELTIVNKVLWIFCVVLGLAVLVVVLLPRITSEETCSYEEAVNRLAKGQFVDVDGKPVHYVRKGAGKPVILIHGYLHNVQGWRENIDALADKFEVYALDLWGFGYSARLKKPQYSFRLFAKQVAGFMDALNIKSASLVGHSMGGGVTVCTAAQHPGRVDKIVLAAPGVIPHKLSLSMRIYRLPFVGEFLGAIPRNASLNRTLRTCCFYDQDKMPSDFVKTFTEPMCIEGSRTAALYILRNVLRYPYASREADMLASAGKPILLAHGRQDKLVPLTDSETLHDKWKGSELVVFEKCGHNLQQEYPEKFNKLVVDFLTR